MSDARFVYCIYIRATLQQVWEGLLEPRFTRQYWDHENVSDWKPGSRWEHRRSNAERTLDLVGEVIASDPPRRLVLTWADPADRARREAHSRVTIELDAIADMVRVTVTHEALQAGSDMLRKISAGWPRVLSSLKSQLETGRPLPTWAN
jgi:uncharacterized protein YndB with AHSA1/START domain